MTTRTDSIADRVRYARVERHRQASEAGGASRFTGDLLFWFCVAAAALLILGQCALVHDSSRTSFTEVLPESDPADGWQVPVVLGLIVLGFALLMAWRSKRLRDANRARSGRARSTS